MFTQRLLLLVGLYIFSINVYAQTGTGVLIGQITDKESKEPIIGATIQLLNDLDVIWQSIRFLL